MRTLPGAGDSTGSGESVLNEAKALGSVRLIPSTHEPGIALQAAVEQAVGSRVCCWHGIPELVLLQVLLEDRKRAKRIETGRNRRRAEA